MKKKIKIFSTIASLCLAVALMAFGVYAATQISLTTTSTIKFEATEIQGYWSLQVVGGDYEGDYKTLTKVTASEATKENSNRLPVDATVGIGAINLEVDASGKATVEYTVQFTLTGEKGASIEVTPTLEEVTGFSVDKTVKQTGSVTKDSTTYSVTFTVTLDTTVSGFDSGASTEADFGLTCVAKPAAKVQG